MYYHKGGIGSSCYTPASANRKVLTKTVTNKQTKMGDDDTTLTHTAVVHVSQSKTKAGVISTRLKSIEVEISLRET